MQRADLAVTVFSCDVRSCMRVACTHFHINHLSTMKCCFNKCMEMHKTHSSTAVGINPLEAACSYKGHARRTQPSAFSPILLLYEHREKDSSSVTRSPSRHAASQLSQVSQQLSRLNLFDFLCWAHEALGRQQGPAAWPTLI